MARYKVTARSYINNRIVEAGEEINFDGKPGSALEPVDAAAKAAKKKVADGTWGQPDAPAAPAAPPAPPKPKADDDGKPGSKDDDKK